MSSRRLRLVVVLAAVIPALVTTLAASGAPTAPSVLQISTSGGHACAVLSGGAVKCWGSNWDGQLGNGIRLKCTASGGRCQKASSGRPVDVVGLGSGVKAVAAGGRHTCALTSRGGVKCWGYNASGQLGDGARTCPSLAVCPRARSSKPVNVVGLASGVRAIAAGGFHTCALLTSGGVKCWGANNSFQLGTPREESSRPIDVPGLSSGASTIATGGRFSCAVTTGATKCWGAPPSVVAAGLASGVASVAVGGSVTDDSDAHACALTTQGGVKCWGSNSSGQLGNGSQTDSRTPVDVVGLTSGVKAIAAGALFTCALTSSGGVKCWGLNRNGELGNGSQRNRSTPVDVAGLRTGIASITAGSLSACALTTQGRALCWGSNYRGTLGTGTAIKLSTKPVDVVFAAKPDSKSVNPSTPSAGGVKSGYFKTPSANIVCSYTVHSGSRAGKSYVGCRIKSGLKPRPAPLRGPKCFSRNEVLLRATGRTETGATICPGEPEGDAGVFIFEGQARVLAYGKTWSGGGLRCTSAITGLTCRNKSGRGFFLSREKWRSF